MNRTTISILTLSLLTIIFWIGFQIYKITTNKELPTATAEQIEPLNPNLDTDILEKLIESTKSVAPK